MPCGLGGKIIHNQRPDKRPFCYSQYAERGEAAPGWLSRPRSRRCAVQWRGPVATGRGAPRHAARRHRLRLPARYLEGIIEEQTRNLKETMMLAAGTGTAFTEDSRLSLRTRILLILTQLHVSARSELLNCFLNSELDLGPAQRVRLNSLDSPLPSSLTAAPLMSG